MRELIVLFFPFLVSSFELNANCTQSAKYFDTKLMQCSNCPLNQTPSSDGLSCICIPGYAKTASTRDLPVFQCEQCGSNTVPSSNHYECQGCPGDISNNECACTTAYTIISEYAQNGNYLPTKNCFQCGQPTYSNSNNYACVACPDPIMNRDPSTTSCMCPNSSYTES